MDNEKSLEASFITNDVETEVTFNESALPTLLTRVKALVVDFCILLAVFSLMSVLIDAIGGVPDFLKGAVFVIMAYLYDPLLTAFTGSTIGHKLMKLKVRRYSEPEKNISIWQALLRFFIKISLSWLSFLTVTGTKHKRAIHDILSGSIVLIDK